MYNTLLTFEQKMGGGVLEPWTCPRVTLPICQEAGSIDVGHEPLSRTFIVPLT